MNNHQSFEWVDFYQEFAIELLAYKNKRDELIGKVKSIYTKTAISMPTLEKDNTIVDIDPFTVFGLFNKSSMTQANRIKIIAAIRELFDLTSSIPQSFNGVPVLNNQNATFYYFRGDRDEQDIDALWELFESALSYAKADDAQNRRRLSTLFDEVIQKKGNGTSKITMALYWIAPDVFLNLDQRNMWYIYQAGKIPKHIIDTLPVIKKKITSEQYFNITEEISAYLGSNMTDLSSFKELSYEAWRYSEEINEQNRRDAEIESQRDNVGEAVGDKGVNATHYWIYSPGENAYMWEDFYDAGIMAIGWNEIGDLRQFTTKDAMKRKMKECFNPNYSYRNDAHATWQFANEVKPGDVIFVKKGMHSIIGRGVVTSDYEHDTSRADGFHNIRRVDWIDKGEWEHPGQAAVKTLTDITPYTEYVDTLNALFDSDVNDNLEDLEKEHEEYTKDNFLDEVYIEEEKYRVLTELLNRKKNIILQGAPGVGKTYAAKRLAYSMMGEKDYDRVATVQFHQSYSYEDFVIGYRPTSTGFELTKGPFYTFCKKAEVDIENDYFFIVDEINRGNLSKIFGELFTLIEKDKRGVALQLLYSDEKFSIPANVHIIGLMNTADRSLAMVDYALRRRFAFFEFVPAFESEGFQEYLKEKDNKKFTQLITAIKSVNQIIENDDTLGRGFRVGHSYFCTDDTIDDIWMNNIVTYEIIPLLEEYWFDDREKVSNCATILREAIR